MTIATVENLTFAVCSGSPNAVHLHALARAYRMSLAAYPQGVALLVVFDAPVKRWMPEFSADFRAGMTKLMRSTESGTLASAFVVVGEGFLLAAFRALLSGAFLLAESKEPYGLFDDPRAAASWLAERASVGVRWDATSLELALAVHYEGKRGP
jgi:hypothetical protein